jgi:hypothetical protein
MLSLQILHSAHFLLWLPTIAAISVQTANKPPIKTGFATRFILTQRMLVAASASKSQPAVLQLKFEGPAEVLAWFLEKREFRALMCVKCFPNLHRGNLVITD